MASGINDVTPASAQNQQPYNPFGVANIPGVPAMTTIDLGNGVISVVPNLPDPRSIAPVTQGVAPYMYTDPTRLAKYMGSFNLGQVDATNAAAGRSTTQAANAEATNLQSYAPSMLALQMSLLGRANEFNQQQLTSTWDKALPGARATITEGLDRARTYAGGRLTSTLEDRAFEMSARSASADMTSSRGFGDDSTFGKKQSDLLSAKERLALSEMGDTMAAKWLTQAAGTIVDKPVKATVGEKLDASPSFSLGTAFSNNQKELLGLSTISPQNALMYDVNQNQYRTTQLQNVFNNNANNIYNANIAQYNAAMANSGLYQQALQGGYNSALAVQQQQAALLIQQQAQSNQQDNQFWQALANLGTQYFASSDKGNKK